MAKLFHMPILLLSYLFVISTISASNELKDDPLFVLLSLVGYDLEDECSKTGSVAKRFYLNPSAGIENKIENDKSYAEFQHSQIGQFNLNTSFQSELKRQLELSTHIGDFMLSEEKRDMAIDHSNKIEELVLTEKISCVDKNEECQINYEGMLNILESEHDKNVLMKTWSQWEKKFEPQRDNFREVIKLLNESATANDAENVQTYWEKLIEYPNAYEKIETLWEQIKPFYLKLHSFLKDRINKKYSLPADINEIPIYMLGSFHGDDWSNIMDVINPHPQYYNTLLDNLNKQKIGGKKLYELTEAMIQKMGLEKFNNVFWKGSNFSTSCPSHLIHYCQQGKTEIVTCDKINLMNFLEAHELSMHVIHSQLAAVDEDTNTYILLYPNRYSAAYEAVKGLGSTLAVRREQLQNSNLVPFRNYEDTEIETNGQLSLLLLAALRVFPRLSYYYIADKFRLETDIDGDLGSEWWKLRKQHSLLSSENNNEWDFLSDETISKNSPYAAKFLGTVLQFQIIDHFLRFAGDNSLMEQINEHHTFREFLKSGMVEPWPELIKKYFDIHDINAEALLSYFEPLEMYMQSAPLDPVTFRTNVYTTTTEKITTVISVEKIVSNIHQLEGKVNSLNINNEIKENNTTVLNENDSEEVKVFQAQHYVWIGIGVLCLLLLIVAILVGRKRLRHKKDLENNRKFQA